MSEKLPRVSADEIIRVLEKLGFNKFQGLFINWTSGCL
jgi:predicted RNA binding protein YcfA (HicA-like mRNA interferase family)